MIFKNLKINEELHKKLKLTAVKSGKTMVALIDEMLDKKIEEMEKEVK